MKKTTPLFLLAGGLCLCLGAVAAGQGEVIINGGLEVGNELTIRDNMGVGTTAPTETLEVAGDMHVSGSLIDGSNSAGTSGQVLKSTETGIKWMNYN